MMSIRFVLFIALLVQIHTVNAQSYSDSITEFQKHLDSEYKNPDKSPLPKKDLRKFKGHAFFPIDSLYKVRAKFERADNALPFFMKTTTGRLPKYEIYGIATFQIDNQELSLHIYQSHRLRNTEEYKNYLFLPFTDLTNGDETYGGGRFIDLEIPDGDTIVIDFNKAYNPYCAYSPKYSCPIPPEENDLPIAIKAGIKAPTK